MATYCSNHNINKKYVECPYNPNHKIPANRMPIHLVKCQKTSDKVLAVCPFNASHRVTKAELQEHLTTCKNKLPVIRQEQHSLDVLKLTKRTVNRLPVNYTTDCKVKADPKPQQTTGDDEEWD